MRQGFPVPGGFVVPPHLALDAPLERHCELAVAALGGYPVAARSSGHLEDMPGASFAGQYVTRLEIGNAAALVRAIAECRESAKSAQVTAYLRRNGLDESRASVSVLVQTMVDAAVAGVAFSIHPTTGREDHALLECCHGLGEKLVSGQTAPTRYVVRLDDGSVVERQAGAENVELDDRLLKELRAHLLELQAFFGTPQDIEWAVDHQGTLWILQSRPITRDSVALRHPGIHDRRLSRRRRRRPCLHAAHVLALPARRAGLDAALLRGIKLLPRDAPQQPWIDMFYGRPYWSVSAVKRALIKVPGFDEEIFDKDLGIQKTYGPSGPAQNTYESTDAAAGDTGRDRARTELSATPPSDRAVRDAIPASRVEPPEGRRVVS